MNLHLTNYKKLLKILALIAMLLITFFASSCSQESNSNLVKCNKDTYSLYPKVVEEILPLFTVEKRENKVYHNLSHGDIVEAFDTQALGAIESGVAKYWYPHYLATVIIAIDRDQSDTEISAWEDLYFIQEEIGFFVKPENIQMTMAAMSYGLEGEDYTLEAAIKLLSSLNKKSFLKKNSWESPILICFDYQAAALIEDGRNIEMIIPRDGTITYEKGLLSNKKLLFAKNTDELLIENKFRLISEESDSSIYPDIAAYESAVSVENYQDFTKFASRVIAQFERRVLKTNRLVSIDDREHLIFALIYISIVTIWATVLLGKSMQKGVSYAAFFTGIILNAWALVRLIKYQVVVNEVLSRYLWYSYYLFQLSLPLLVLWMAWAIDKPRDKIFPPKWWRLLTILIAALIIFVFTNDIHGYVFKLDLSRSDWAINYTYGFGYYLVLFVCMLNISIAFLIMMKKSIRSPRKKAFILPLIVFFLFGLYNYKYIMRDSLIFETDLTIVTGIFVMLMFEASIRSALIPVNTKYIDIFRRSPLRMQIVNRDSQVLIASALAASIDKDTSNKAIEASPHPVLQEDEYLLFANSIPGGYALWREDVSRIKKLHREIQQSTEKLREANTILAKEEKTKRIINEKNAKKQVMEQLEIEIAEKIEKLSRMIEKLECSENHSRQTTRIALLLCYIKQRCNLFFKEKERDLVNIDELIIYIDELCEIAKYSDLQVAIINEIKEDISIRHTTLFYDFFYAIVDFSVQKSCPYIIVDIGMDKEFLTMKLLPSIDIGQIVYESKLIESLEAAKGKIENKYIEDTRGISISFPRGGTEND